MASLPKNYLQESQHSPLLPVELTDEIIDCLLAVDLPEIEALKAATLVCKAWSPRAQSHLFRRMTWTINFDARVAEEPMATFSSSNVKKYVQHITIELSRFPEWNTLAVERLMSGFTSVTSLKLRPCLFFASATNELSRVLASAFPHTRELQIHRIGFEEDNGLLRLLCAFRSLAAFDMAVLPTTPMSLYEDGTHNGDIEPLDSLQYVTLSLVHIPASLIQNHPDHRHQCHPLMWFPFRPREPRYFCQTYIDPQLAPLDLHNCRSLIKLELGDNNNHTSDPSEDIDAIGWMSASLATLPSPCPIQTLVVTFYTPFVKEDTLQALDGVTVLAGLKSFTVGISIDPEPGKWNMDDDDLRYADDLLRPAMKRSSPKAELIVKRAHYSII